MSYDLQNYTECKDRIAEFYKLHPQGSLQFTFEGQLEINGQAIIWGVARAYRSPEDERPCIGTAWEFVPGKTPFTRGSELMNLETSAWARCLGAMNIGLNGGKIASADEVKMAKDRDPWANPPDSPKTPVKADFSRLEPTQVGEHTNQRKTPESGATVSNMARPASTKQINYFKSLMYQAWEANGYKGKPTEEEMVSFVNEMTKSDFKSVSEWTARVMKDMLDDQSNLQQNLMSWNKDSRLWQSEVF